MLLGCNMSLQCECGYDLTGLTAKRCPEWGGTVTRHKPGRMWPYMLGGFLIGFGLLAVPSVALIAPRIIAVPDEYVAAYVFGVEPAALLERTLYGVALVAGLGLAVVTGLTGMLIGKYRAARHADRARTEST